MIAVRLETPQKIRDLQRKLYLKAKSEPKFRFYVLADKVWRGDILQYAYRLVRANGGAPGIDGESFQSIETGEGEAKFLSRLQQELQEKSYRAQPVRRVYIAKADGKELDGDNREGKRTLMLIHLLESASETERERLRTMLSQPRD